MTVCILHWFSSDIIFLSYVVLNEINWESITSVDVKHVKSYWHKLEVPTVLGKIWWGPKLTLRRVIWSSPHLNLTNHFTCYWLPCCIAITWGRSNLRTSVIWQRMTSMVYGRRVLEELPTLACHWVVCIGHLPFAAEVLNTSRHPNFSVSTIVMHKRSYPVWTLLAHSSFVIHFGN